MFPGHFARCLHLGKRLQPYAGANPVTWWEWEVIEASREMLKSAVAGDAAADETEQANTGACQLARLAFSQFRFSKTNEDWTKKVQGLGRVSTQCHYFLSICFRFKVFK